MGAVSPQPALQFPAWAGVEIELGEVHAVSC